MIKFIKKYTDCCGYAELYKDGEKIITGDSYHNKIDEFINGYVLAYKHLGIEYSYSEKEIKKCPNYCDED